eukprot:TRINITY_DN16492_c0_g1_i3.p1 TRINITY_DN16492_c0_g1~~TRINITY_DN16492_c0_g1_i3.p1  ORF type:complete len:146 (-),score=25.93 TRINITY_DN16492_c0_g1_i3:691-1128(-)
MEQVEQLPWFASRLEKWQARWNQCTQSVTVEEKIQWLCKLCPKQPPTRASRLDVPKELVPEGSTATFSAGEFLKDIKLNWCEGAKPHTRLSREHMEQVEQLPWFASRLEKWQACWNQCTQSATVEEKVQWLCTLCPKQPPTRRHA